MRSGRRISANELQTTGRRRRRTGSRAVVLVMAFVFAVLLFYVRDIKMRLKEVQETLQEIVSVQNGGMGAEGGEVPPASSFAGGEGSGIGAAVSGLAGRTGDEGAALDADGDAAGTKRPVERTLEEALQRLEVLGEKNEVIAEICVQSGRFHEKLLLALANNPEMRILWRDIRTAYTKIPLQRLPSRMTSGKRSARCCCSGIRAGAISPMGI